jgi:hypothetical protein
MNAKTEFINFCKDKPKIRCVSIYLDYSTADEIEHITLKVFYIVQEYDEFLKKIDKEYDRQELFGTIWFENNTWAERDESNGNEGWSYYKCPSIPDHLCTK